MTEIGSVLKQLKDHRKIPMGILFYGLLILCYPSLAKPQDSLRVVSYNVENLFDTTNDPGHLDGEFTPLGEKSWTPVKYRQKLKNISQVISDIGKWTYPELVALCEVEGKSVVEDLVKTPLLRPAGYHHVVTSGRDPRGIEVALLWSPQHFSLVAHREIPTYVPDGLPKWYMSSDSLANQENRYGGRNALWATLLSKCDGIHWELFVIHSPSRRGGVRSTSSARISFTRRIRAVIDSLHQVSPSSRIIVLGDFNDNPRSPSLTEGLGAFPRDQIKEDSIPLLINLSPDFSPFWGGSHFFEGSYWLPDQIIVSFHFLSPNFSPSLQTRYAQIFSPSYLCVTNKRGVRCPRRSFRGILFQNGFSDHFPVFINLIY